MAVVAFGRSIPMHCSKYYVSSRNPVFCRGARFLQLGPQALGPSDIQRTRRIQGGPVDKAADEYEVDAGDDPEYVANNLQDYSDLIVRDGIARSALLRKPQKWQKPWLLGRVKLSTVTAFSLPICAKSQAR